MGASRPPPSYRFRPTGLFIRTFTEWGPGGQSKHFKKPTWTRPGKKKKNTPGPDGDEFFRPLQKGIRGQRLNRGPGGGGRLNGYDFFLFFSPRGTDRDLIESGGEGQKKVGRGRGGGMGGTVRNTLPLPNSYFLFPGGHPGGGHSGRFFPSGPKNPCVPGNGRLGGGEGGMGVGGGGPRGRSWGGPNPDE